MSGSQPWHPFVFDIERRRFVGDFEGMYRAEGEQGFDSWHQSGSVRLDNDVALALTEEIEFSSALDLGCGKGAFTARLATTGRRISGVDVSPTAIEAARGAYPQIEWIVAPIGKHLARAEPVELIILREVLSYLEDWRQVIARSAELARWLLVGLYLPPDPIGFVKSFDELETEIGQHCEIRDSALLAQRSIAIYLAESRARL